MSNILGHHNCKQFFTMLKACPTHKEWFAKITTAIEAMSELQRAHDTTREWGVPYAYNGFLQFKLEPKNLEERIAKETKSCRVDLSELSLSFMITDSPLPIYKYQSVKLDGCNLYLRTDISKKMLNRFADYQIVFPIKRYLLEQNPHAVSINDDYWHIEL